MNLRDTYQHTRKHSRDICAPLTIEDHIPQPILEVSPPKWQLAHTSWFFEAFVLSKFLPGYKVFNKTYAYLFNSYYENMGDRIIRQRRGILSRPTLQEVIEYRAYVDDHMVKLMEGMENKNLKELITLGIQHEQQHQELLLSDLKYILWVNPLKPAYGDKIFTEKPNPQIQEEWITSPEGIFNIGARADQGFVFDNELKQHKVFLESFQISTRLVTNGDYINFINDGGYQNHALWHAEAWDWIQRNQITHPLYWEKTKDGKWHQFTLRGMQEIDPIHQLCHISFYEAAAFAEWMGMRLPTEFEWEACADRFAWGDRWEWTESAYLPYPGYKKEDGAVGEYNGKFMVNQMVLRGASVATCPEHSRKTYRNFWHPHTQWQYSGIRLAKKQA